jgi:hypothetical protein
MKHTLLILAPLLLLAASAQARDYNLVNQGVKDADYILAKYHRHITYTQARDMEAREGRIYTELGCTKSQVEDVQRGFWQELRENTDIAWE